ncbi:hypothetical protein BDR06DRAFT_127974 [Suillus hirtellus]|nr:hypothetical protein BDR06DRAFT_127974 [Suillus hirtellus]
MLFIRSTPGPPDEIVQLLYFCSQNIYIHEPALYHLLACKGSNATKSLNSQVSNLDRQSVERILICIPTQATYGCVSQQEGINCIMDPVWHGLDRVLFE